MGSEKGINEGVDLSNLFISSNSSLDTYFNDINHLNDNANNIDVESPFNCNVDLSSFDYKNKNDTLTLFHLSIASLSKYKEELETKLNTIDLKFDASFDKNIKGYKCYSTCTEAGKGGSILYIAHHFNSKPLQILYKMMYKSKQSESVFVEICNKYKKNVIVGCIYSHPSMDLNLMMNFSIH